jgi:hypothetical protein
VQIRAGREIAGGNAKVDLDLATRTGLFEERDKRVGDLVGRDLDSTDWQMTMHETRGWRNSARPPVLARRGLFYEPKSSAQAGTEEDVRM